MSPLPAYAGEQHSDGMRHGHSPDSSHHNHGQLVVPANQSVPTVDLVIHPDAVQGWNLEIKTTNFQFAPERVNQVSTPMEGHAHLYINGKKITRLYGPWYYLEQLEPGRHEVQVSLNANGHEQLIHNNQPIMAQEILVVPSPQTQ